MYLSENENYKERRKGVIQLNGSVLRCEVSAKCPELETVFENCT